MRYIAVTVVIYFVCYLTPAALSDSDDIIQNDWDDEEWSSRESRFTFPRDEDECQGERMTLQSGETAIIKSHRSFGKKSYPNNFRCRWIFKPVQCDLNLVCYMKTRTQSRWNCEGSDYLRIMKGTDSSVEGNSIVKFHKKYCGKRTASLKFSGNETLKLVFKSVPEPKQIPSKLDGWTCKVVCVNPSRPSRPDSTTQSFLDLLATSKPLPVSPDSSTSTTTSTIAPTTTTTTTTTSTTPTTTTPQSSATSCMCGQITDGAKRRWKSKNRGKIICPHGDNCDSDPVPWQVGITGVGRRKPWCGGSIINARYILSAAHCFEDSRTSDPRRMLVTLGDLDWSEDDEWPSMRVGVEKIILHPQFRQGALFNNDFAILRLERPLEFDKYDWIRPVCLADHVPGDLLRSGVVSGWGWTSWSTTGASQSPRLQSVKVDIMSHQECVSSYNTGEITDTMLCAASPGADSCRGDSGGPMTIDLRGRSVLVGVVSWGKECARAQWPGVYSKVESALDWIRRNTRDTEWCAATAATAASIDNRGDRRTR